MKRLWIGLALCVLIVSLAPGDGQAESIWLRRSQRYGFLFNDQRARCVGDILTVLVAENNAINQREQRQLKKATDTGAKFTFQGTTSSDNAKRNGALSADLVASVDAVIRTGSYDGHVGFMPAHFHTAGELRTEMESAGLSDVTVYGVEGPTWPALDAAGLEAFDELVDAAARCARPGWRRPPGARSAAAA